MKMKKVVTNHSYKRKLYRQGNVSVVRRRRKAKRPLRRTIRIVMMMRSNNEE